MSPPTLFFFFRRFYSRSFAFSPTFQNQLVSFYKKACWDFDQNCAESVGQFWGRSDILIFNFLIYEQSVCLFFKVFTFCLKIFFFQTTSLTRILLRLKAQIDIGISPVVHPTESQYYIFISFSLVHFLISLKIRSMDYLQR